MNTSHSNITSIVSAHIVVADVEYLDVGRRGHELLEPVQRPQLVVAQLQRLQRWDVLANYLYHLKSVTSC